MLLENSDWHTATVLILHCPGVLNALAYSHCPEVGLVSLIPSFGHPVYIYHFANQVAIFVVVYPSPLVHLDMFIQHFNMAIILSARLNN